MTDAGSFDLDQDFAPAGRVQLHAFDRQGGALLPEDRGFDLHRWILGDGRFESASIMTVPTDN